MSLNKIQIQIQIPLSLGEDLTITCGKRILDEISPQIAEPEGVVEPSSFNIVTIIIIVVGALVLIFLFLLTAICVRKRRRHNFELAATKESMAWGGGMSDHQKFTQVACLHRIILEYLVLMKNMSSQRLRLVEISIYRMGFL